MSETEENFLDSSADAEQSVMMTGEEQNITHSDDADARSIDSKSHVRYALKRGRIPQTKRIREPDVVPTAQIVDVVGDAIGARIEHGDNRKKAKPVTKSTEVVDDDMQSAYFSSNRDRGDRNKAINNPRQKRALHGSKKPTTVKANADAGKLPRTAVPNPVKSASADHVKRVSIWMRFMSFLQRLCACKKPSESGKASVVSKASGEKKSRINFRKPSNKGKRYITKK